MCLKKGKNLLICVQMVNFKVKNNIMYGES